MSKNKLFPFVDAIYTQYPFFYLDSGLKVVSYVFNKAKKASYEKNICLISGIIDILCIQIFVSIWENISSVKCKVSVIIPAYNCQGILGEALQSILHQTHEDLEILVADDGSKDRTKSVIDSFSDKRIRTFHNDVNIGYLQTVNNLLNRATGDYITFQDADDWSDTSRIGLQLRAIESDKVDACGTAIYYTNLRGKTAEKTILSHKLRRGA